MITLSKKLVNPMALKPEDVCIEDIAHGLAHICRFGGQCPHFYSVANHSSHVAAILPDALRIHGIMHDFAEAYLGDIIRPVKSNLFFLPQDNTGYYNIEQPTAFREIEKRTLSVIYEGLGVKEPTKEEAALVKEADSFMLRAELFWLFGKEGEALLEGDALLPKTFPDYVLGEKPLSYDDTFFATCLSPTTPNLQWIAECFIREFKKCKP